MTAQLAVRASGLAFEAAAFAGTTNNLSPNNRSGGFDDLEVESPGSRKLFRLTRRAGLLVPFHPDPEVLDEHGRRVPSRVAGCGCERLSLGLPRAIGRAGDRASEFGVRSCGSVWLCARCAATVASERAREVTHAVNFNRSRGRHVTFATLTTRHYWGMPLRKLRRAVAAIWTRVIGGKGWKEWREEQHAHCIRRLEVTYGANGWHPHIHVLIFTDEPLGEVFREWLLRRWQRATARVLAARLVGSDEHAVDVQAVASADGASRYLSKLGLEITDELSKQGRASGSRTPWQILADVDEAAREGRKSPRDVALWCEYAEAMHGARQLTWSNGLRWECGLAAEESDETIAERASLEPEPIVFVPDEGAREFYRNVDLRCRVRASITLGIAAGLTPDRMRHVALDLVERALGRMARERWEREQARWSSTDYRGMRDAALALSRARAVATRERKRIECGTKPPRRVRVLPESFDADTRADLAVRRGRYETSNGRVSV